MAPTNNGNGKGRGVTVSQLIFALAGELCVLVAFIWLDRIASERRVTQIEERVAAIYSQLPALRAEQAKQDERLTILEHEVLKLGIESRNKPGGK